MAAVKMGDTVRISYAGRFEDGTLFESTEEDGPITVRVGSGDYLKALEDGIIGMSPGATKTMELGQVHGPRDDRRVFEFEACRLPSGLDPNIGRQFHMYRADGELIPVTVVGMTDTNVTLDSNHPLAGKNLIYEVTLVEIV